MELPKKLLDQYPTVRENNTVTMYRQYPALLVFDNGGTERVSITAKNKSYWTGQLENEIMREWNKVPSHAHKIVKVKLYRNTSDGGLLLRGNRVINVN